MTGGGTGIGKAVARRLADDGASVTIVGRRADVLARASLEINDAVESDTVVPLVAGLSDPEQVTDAAAAIRADGPVDVLVLNAGGSVGGDPSTLAELADAWRRDFDANVLTAVLLTEALRDDLVARAAASSGSPRSRRCAARDLRRRQGARCTAGRSRSRPSSGLMGSP